MTIVEISPFPNSPFDASGVVRGPDGVKRYSGLPESLVAMLRDRVSRHSTHEAIKEVGGESLSYGELWDRASRIAGGLRTRGVEHRDRVAITLPAGCDWVVSFFGILLAGGTVVAVNTRFAETEVAHVVSDSGTRIVIGPDLPLPDGDPHVADDIRGRDVAALFYTSGTTGRPKGARLSHDNFLSNLENVVRTTPLDRDLGTHFRTLISVPLFHVTGCNSQLLSTLYLGGTALILPVLNIPTLLRVIAEEQISWLVSVPAIYGLAMAHQDFPRTDVSSVRWVGYGGAPITTTMVMNLARAFPHARLSNGYGCTETSSLVSQLPHELTDVHADSVGLAVPVVDLALDVHGDDPQVGELLVRGPNVIDGYWNNPPGAAQAFEEGWFRTGDILRIDDEGLLYIFDRIKDMVNRGGENVYCIEVENALATVPGVVESAVCGVPDSLLGEKVGAVVVGEPGLTPASIVASLTGQLADFKIPQYIAIREAPLPRTPAGKVRKAELQTATLWGTPLH